MFLACTSSKIIMMKFTNQFSDVSRFNFNKKIWFLSNPIFLLVIMMTVLSGCSEWLEGDSKDSDFNLDNIQGIWVRIGGNNPVNNGIKVKVADFDGKVIDKSHSEYHVGEIKWKEIIAKSENDFDHLELGSDRNYYPGSIEIGMDDTLRLWVEAAGLGNIQKWVREANFTPQSTFLKVLHGNWLRVGGNNPVNNGVKVKVVNHEGEVIDKSKSGYQVGEIKWKDIYAIDGESFLYQELGSDRNYYSASMEMGMDDTLRLSVEAAGPGNIQKWVRE